MLTRKYMNRLALIVASITDYRQREYLSLRIGLMIREENPRFRWDMWNKACMVKGDNHES